MGFQTYACEERLTPVLTVSVLWPPSYILLKFEVPNVSPSQKGTKLGQTFEMALC